MVVISVWLLDNVGKSAAASAPLNQAMQLNNINYMQE